MRDRCISLLLALSIALLGISHGWPAQASDAHTCCPCAGEQQKGCSDCPAPASQKRCGATTPVLLFFASEDADLSVGCLAMSYADCKFHFSTRTERPPVPPPKVS
jgi:hypothetical protein